MGRINVLRFGFAFGVAGAILYGGCVMSMALLGRAASIRFFNSLLHGIDTSSIIRMNVPWWEATMGVLQTFFLCWLVGACVAAVYNLTGQRS